MLEGGALVPFIVNWPGVTPAGKVCADFLDATDLVPTFAELAGATLPKDKLLDGRSFAPQIRGTRGNPRDHVFMELAREWCVRSDGWKLNQKGELFDMSKAPFEEKLVATSADTDASKAARTQLTAALAKLNPAGGILDDGDGTGRHADKTKKEKKKTESPTAPAPVAPAPVPKPATPPAPGEESGAERAAKFDRLDKDKKGKLTIEEYVSRQSDPEGAKKRFEKFDTNRDGGVTREEYIANGAKKPKQ